ncbi:hypothetical protein [Streptomyces sp. URMC 127]|uniref:hypothetical protein n=1 Tax=Streptomyces sp. URMC 127 TaxID=3423402 RepID=UPI003F536923
MPHTVTPFPNETLESYTHRLAAVNRIPERHLRTPSRWLRCPLNELDLLALLSGQPRTSLAWAIPELRRYAPGIAPPLKSLGVMTRFACRRCVWQAGGTGSVHVHVRSRYDLVCVRHGIWHSEGVAFVEQQIDLAPIPQVTRAQVLINRLEQRHGERFIAECYRVCERHWSELDRRGLVRNDATALLDRLHTTNPREHKPFGPHHRFRLASRFPQLARFIALVVALSLKLTTNMSREEAGPRILAEFERLFTLDYRPRSITGPWMRTALVHLVVRMAHEAQVLRLSETEAPTPSHSI